MPEKRQQSPERVEDHTSQTHDSETVRHALSVNVNSPGIETRPTITSEMVSPDPPPTNSNNSQDAQVQASDAQSDNEDSNA